MISIQDIAMAIIRNNPQVAGSPRIQEMINVIESGDQKKGEEMARNLCHSFGVAPEKAVEDAKQFFRVF